MLFKIRKAYKWIILILGFTFLLFVSEILYALKNESPNNIINLYHLLFLEKNIKNNNCEKTFSHLFKTTDFVIKFRQTRYPEIVPKNYFTKSKYNLHDFCSSLTYFDILNNSFVVNNINLLDINLAYLYYKFAVVPTEEILVKNVPDLFETAIFLDPDFSYYYVELSNYYLSINQYTKANEIINLCKSLEYPKLHCEEYFDNYLLINKKQPIGFLKEEIKEYLFNKNIVN